MSENIDSIRDQILKGRKKFIAMAITYFLGVFNDNFFKQVIMLLALSYGKNKLQGWATVVFTLPYLIVAAPAGWLADKYSKRNVIIGAKWLELFAMIAGALGILYFNGNAPIMSFNWILILAMLGIMGLQSSIFSPALNGSIPELYPKSYIQTANGIVKLVTTFAILSGIAIAGIVLDYGIESQLAQTYNKIETLNTKYASVKNKDILRTLLSETIKSSLDEYSKFKNGAVIRIKPENDTFIIKMHDSKEKNVQTGIIKLDVEQCNMIVNSIKKGNKSNLNKVALAILVVAILGVLISYGSPKRKGAGSTVAFPWKGPWNSLKDLWEIKKDTLLITTIFACTFFWFIGMLQVLLINQMGVDQFKWSKTATSMLLVAQMIGVAIGALLASRFSKGDRWYSILQPALLMMAVFYGLLGSIVFFPKSIQYHLSVLFLTLAGVGGGLYLIPLESFLQIRPDAARKGKVIAAANFAALGGSMIAGPFYNLLVYINFQPTNCFALMGIFSIIVMFLLFWALLLVEVKEDRVYNGGRNFMDRCLILIGRILLSFRYKIKVKGMEQIVQKGTEKIIFLPNHIALVDPAIIAIALYNNFAPRSIGDSANISNPLVNWITKRMGVRPIPDMSQSGVDAKIELDKIMKKTTEGIKQGDNLMLYPSGHIKQTIKEEIGARSGVSILLNDVPDARIVLVRQNGLWGSSFSHGATGKKPDLLRGFSNGIKTIFRNLIFFVPKREILVELIEPENFPYGKEKLEMNQFMEQIFNEDAWPNTYVPYHFISKEKKHQLEEPIEACIEGDVNSVPEATKQIVIEYLQELVGIDDIRPEQKLAIDLSMDSLSMVEVLSWLEQEFGFPQGDTESYTTVGDILLGAIGQGVSGKEVSLKPVSKKWFSYDDDSSDVSIADGGNIAEVFLNQAANSPQKVIFADQTTGEKTYSDVITGIYALKPVIESLEGENLGLMFPASVGANIFYLATIFSGKTPVMVNWTTGIKNIIFSLNNVGVKHIITSKLLVSKLQSQGINFDEISDMFVYTEDFAKKISTGQKIKAFLKAKFSWGSLRDVKVRENAVILFTSGSESNPKSVPLTHENILCNCRDIMKMVSMQQKDKMLGMLPPFHSFGLSTTSILAFCAGIQTVFHPNPTEGKNLVRLIEAYKVTLMLGTPTFLQGILKSSSKKQIDKLRLVITGAEKCPQSVYTMAEELCPDSKILEGYGLTECSPIVSANNDDIQVKGSIGIIMPSLEYAIVSPDNFERRPIGENGLLLLNGPSIFKGYINHDGKSPFVEFEDKSWFNTGDLVVEGDNKVITFAGRIKRFIKLGGEMVSLPAIENVLAPHFEDVESDGPVVAVEATKSESNPEVVLFTTVDTDRATVNGYIKKSGLSPLHNIRIIKKIDAIPVLGTGKTNYRGLKELL